MDHGIVINDFISLKVGKQDNTLLIWSNREIAAIVLRVCLWAAQLFTIWPGESDKFLGRVCLLQYYVLVSWIVNLNLGLYWISTIDIRVVERAQTKHVVGHIDWHGQHIDVFWIEYNDDSSLNQL